MSRDVHFDRWLRRLAALPRYRAAYGHALDENLWLPHYEAKRTVEEALRLEVEGAGT